MIGRSSCLRIVFVGCKLRAVRRGAVALRRRARALAAGVAWAGLREAGVGSGARSGRGVEPRSDAGEETGAPAAGARDGHKEKGKAEGEGAAGGPGRPAGTAKAGADGRESGRGNEDEGATRHTGSGRQSETGAGEEAARRRTGARQEDADGRRRGGGEGTGAGNEGAISAPGATRPDRTPRRSDGPTNGASDRRGARRQGAGAKANDGGSARQRRQKRNERRRHDKPPSETEKARPKARGSGEPPKPPQPRKGKHGEAMPHARKGPGRPTERRAACARTGSPGRRRGREAPQAKGRGIRTRSDRRPLRRGREGGLARRGIMHQPAAAKYVHV